MKKNVFFVIAVSMSLSIFATEKREIDFSNRSFGHHISVSTDKGNIAELNSVVVNRRYPFPVYTTKSLTIEFEPVNNERFRAEIMLRAQGGRHGEVVDTKKYEIEINKIKIGAKPHIKISYRGNTGFILSTDDQSLGLTYKEISSNNNQQN